MMGHSDQPAVYEIRVRGCLAGDYATRRLGDMELKITPQMETILRGTVVDQAALHGLLNALRDLNVTLLLVQRLEGVTEQREACS